MRLYKTIELWSKWFLLVVAYMVHRGLIRERFACYWDTHWKAHLLSIRKQVHVSRECFRFVIRHLVIESRWVGEFEWKLQNTEKKTNGLERWDEQIEDELFQAVFVLYTDGQFLYRRVFEEEATVTMSSEELQTVFNALVIY